MQRNFLRGLLIVLVPTVLFGAVAVFKPMRLGIDLAGGTNLLYEVDLDKSKRRQALADGGPAAARPATAAEEGRTGLSSDEMAKLAEALKRRIDPVDTKNIIIRPVGDSRIEILLPFGAGARAAGKEQLTEEDVQTVKDLVSKVGVLEFRILANDVDDAEAVRAAEAEINGLSADEADRLARAGLPPPPPPGDYTVTVNGVEVKGVRYEWVELSKDYRQEHGLSEAMAGDTPPLDRRGNPQSRGLFDALKGTRGKTYQSVQSGGEDGARLFTLYYSRDFKKDNPAPDEKGKKKVEYFVLTRVSDLDRLRVGGDVSLSARASNDDAKGWAVNFTLNTEGAVKFGAMTERNRPTPGTATRRALGILLDNRLMSNPSLNARISNSGQITGGFTKKTVDDLVQILRAGALTAELKPNPVSENTVGSTLGEDTKRKGLTSVGVAFAAVLVFMCWYYRFAGVVACVALLLNLLLTVGGMIALNAAFTLAGLAGIVLMLGMAVDANVLIYERLREEREKGATLAAALRAGYDRAFPTIIDTHLASIFTAIVLFTFGNDNLKGFAVSLTLGLVISLFTSLYVTRLMFDYWLVHRRLADLRFHQLFRRPNINFMGIRKQMFALTAGLTVAGLALFLARGDDGLNVDFRGGTVYGGRLAEARPLGGADGMLALLGEERQAAKLQVNGVREVSGTTYEIDYAGATQPALVTLANAPASLDELKARAGKLPGVSVEQVIVSDRGDGQLPSGTSKSFVVRTTEKEKELVQVMIDRLLRDETGKPLLDSPTIESIGAVTGTAAELSFSRPVSVKFVEAMLAREFARANYAPATGLPFVLEGVPAAPGSPERQQEEITKKFQRMRVDVSKNPEFAALKTVADVKRSLAGAVAGAVVEADAGADKQEAALGGILAAAKTTFDARPEPERLETFDAALAADTQARALYAILASWAAILLYLWFRFGSWTFGAAAVVCLVHDLCFTLGAIAVCHYLYTLPGAGSLLQLQDFKIDLAAVAALLTLIGYSVNDTIVVFDRIREVRGKNPRLTEQMINDSVNQALSRTVLASLTTFLVVAVLYFFGGEGVHLFSFVMVVGVLIGTYSSIYVAAPLLLFFGEGKEKVETPAAAGKAVAAR